MSHDMQQGDYASWEMHHLEQRSSTWGPGTGISFIKDNFPMDFRGRGEGAMVQMVMQAIESSR